jgi:hypothetical protein
MWVGVIGGHAAGMDGSVESLFIDAALRRDRVGGAGGEGNSSFVPVVHFLQNWRSDIVMLLRDKYRGARPIERVRYSPYGTPTSRFALDVPEVGGGGGRPR